MPRVDEEDAKHRTDLIPRVSGNSLASEESILQKCWSDGSVGVELRCDPSDPLHPGRDVREDETVAGNERKIRSGQGGSQINRNRDFEVEIKLTQLRESGTSSVRSESERKRKVSFEALNREREDVSRPTNADDASLSEVPLQKNKYESASEREASAT